jgi:uncharacterized protein YbjT (DUF2867 family)
MILVTGATGTVGSEVVRRLLAAGERPRALVRDPDKARERLGEQVEHVVGDLNQTETVGSALAGVDRLFLVTTQSSRQPEWERRVIEAATRGGVGQIVKLSVFRADERSPLQIARQHAQAERALEQSGVAFTIVRPVFFMQNLLAMLRDGAIYTAAADGRVAMVDARDAAAVAVTALTKDGHRGRTYTLTGPEALSFDEVANTLSRETGRSTRHVHVSPDKVRAALEGFGVAAWFADDMAKLHGMLADGYEDLVTNDVRAVTGSPPRDLAQFVRDIFAIQANPR